MKRLFLQLSLALLILGVYAQSPDSNEVLAGDTTIRKLLVQYPGSFNAIDVKSGLLNIYLYQGDTNKIVIEGGQDVANNIEIDIDGNYLEIDGSKLKNIATLNVYFTELKRIKCSHIGRIESKTPINDGDFSIEASGTSKMNLELYVNSLGTEISGASGITLKGEAKVHEFEVSGAAKLNAKNFQTAITRLEVSGAGDVIINATEEITGEISGAAKLLFFGEPNIDDLEVSGVAVIKGKALTSDAKDTVSVKIGNYDLRITENGDDETEDGHKHKHKSKSSGDYEIWSGFELGITGYLNNNNTIDLPANYNFMELNYAKSASVGFNLFEKDMPIIKNYLELGTGLGFEINNYKFKNNTRLADNPNVLTGYIDTINSYDKTKLRVSYLTLPLFLEINTSSNPSNAFHLGAGVLLGYNIGSKTKTIRSDNDFTEKARGNFHINPFKYSLMFRVGYGENMVVFANYSLAELFETNNGPEMYPFTVGLAFVDF